MSVACVSSCSERYRVCNWKRASDVAYPGLTKWRDSSTLSTAMLLPKGAEVNIPF